MATSMLLSLCMVGQAHGTCRHLFETTSSSDMIFRTQLCYTPPFSHNFVTYLCQAKLCHISLSHMTLSHATLPHTSLSHLIFHRHTHTTLSHIVFHIRFLTIWKMLSCGVFRFLNGKNVRGGTVWSVLGVSWANPTMSNWYEDGACKIF